VLSQMFSDVPGIVNGALTLSNSKNSGGE
jgi:hypothetical protein